MAATVSCLKVADMLTNIYHTLINNYLFQVMPCVITGGGVGRLRFCYHGDVPVSITNVLTEGILMVHLLKMARTTFMFLT